MRITTSGLSIKGVILLIVLLAAVPPAAAMINPAAGYCNALGYAYSTKPDAQGNEVGYCTLSNGQSVYAWQFLLGQTAEEYSYCAKMGYATRVVNDSKACGIFAQPSCAACVFPNGSAMEVTRLMGLDFREKICTQNGCRDPSDYPLPAPYIIPPPGGQQQGTSLPSWMILLGIVLLIIIIGGAFFTLKRRKGGETSKQEK
jgi:putative hemolysin